MRTFRLNRKTDISGVSGTGIVAEGVQFHDGQCALSWFGAFHTIEISPSIEDLMKIHGHGGATTLEWIESTTPLSGDFNSILSGSKE